MGPLESPANAKPENANVNAAAKIAALKALITRPPVFPTTDYIVEFPAFFQPNCAPRPAAELSKTNNDAAYTALARQVPVWQGSARFHCLFGAGRAALRLARCTWPRGCCRSSVVEHPLGKGEVVSSILTGSTTAVTCIAPLI
jgi:hypothetical protein